MKNKEEQKLKINKKINQKGIAGITLIALVITIVLNCCEAAMERMLKKELILNI